MAQDTVDRLICLNKLKPQTCQTVHLKIHGAQEQVNVQDHLYIYGSDQSNIAATQKQKQNNKKYWKTYKQENCVYTISEGR